MEIELKYGEGHLKLSLPDTARVTLMRSGELPILADPVAALHAALDAPLGVPPLEERPRPKTVAVAVPDETRPFPLKLLLPPFLARLRSAWPALEPENIRIVVGGGLHPQPDSAQLARILPPEVLTGGYTIVPHDAERSTMSMFGSTSRGTMVMINAAVGTAEFKAVLGMIDPHQFVGMTGGSKGVTIGCAAKATIEHNHRLMYSPQAFVGNVDDNPVRQDLNEAGQLVGIDFAVNVVLNPLKQVVGLLAGEPVSCLTAGSRIAAKIYSRTLDEPYDIAVCSCGGYPKDICLYQAQKGLNLASRCVRPGGRILLLAACPQGVGDDCYYEYVQRFKTPEEQMEEFARNGFRMGAHKAFLFSRTISRYDVAVHSELDAETLGRCLLRKRDAQTILDAWLAERPDDRVAVIFNANTLYFQS